MRRATTTVNRIRLAAVAAVGLATLAGCGSSSDAASTPPPGAAADTTTTVATTTTTAPPRGPALAELRPCTDADADYRTAPDWITTSLPDGMVVDHAVTLVHRADPDLAAAGSDREEIVLLATDDKRMVTADLVLVRDHLDGFEVDADLSLGHATTGDVVDEVRGRPGRIQHVVNRGDSAGTTSARWIEGDHGWQARSRRLDVHQLATALEPLTLDGDDVDDPSGRFEEVGRRSGLGAQERETTIVVTAGGESDGDLVELTVVDTTADGDGLADVFGLQMLMQLRPTITLGERDGRLVADADGWLMTTLADGTGVRVEAAPTVTAEQVDALVGGLHRVDAEHPANVPLVPSYWAPDPADPTGAHSDLCREPGDS